MKLTGMSPCVAVLLALCAGSLAAQDTTAPRRADTVTSAARAPRVAHVPKRSRADSLRGSYTSAGRRWWDVTFYDLHVSIQPKDSSIAGWNAISYRVVDPPSGARALQIDLMQPLVVDSMVQNGRTVPYRREGNAFFATPSASSRSAGGHDSGR